MADTPQAVDGATLDDTQLAYWYSRTGAVYCEDEDVWVACWAGNGQSLDAADHPGYATLHEALCVARAALTAQPYRDEYGRVQD